MVRLVLGLVIVIAGENSGATAQTIFGGGTTSCGEWVRFRSFEDRQDNIRERANIYQLQSWLHGFLTGYNVASGTPDILSPPPRYEALNAWVDNYCKSNPLDPLGEAAFALAKELRSREERK